MRIQSLIKVACMGMALSSFSCSQEDFSEKNPSKSDADVCMACDATLEECVFTNNNDLSTDQCFNNYDTCLDANQCQPNEPIPCEECQSDYNGCLSQIPGLKLSANEEEDARGVCANTFVSCAENTTGMCQMPSKFAWQFKSFTYSYMGTDIDAIDASSSFTLYADGNLLVDRVSDPRATDRYSYDISDEDLQLAITSLTAEPLITELSKSGYKENGCAPNNPDNFYTMTVDLKVEGEISRGTTYCVPIFPSTDAEKALDTAEKIMEMLVRRYDVPAQNPGEACYITCDNAVETCAAQAGSATEQLRCTSNYTQCNHRCED